MRSVVRLLRASAMAVACLLLAHCGGQLDAPETASPGVPAPEASLFAQQQAFWGSRGLVASVPPQAGSSYRWTLTNGTATGTLRGATDGATVTYDLGDTVGTYELSVTVRNARGDTATRSRTLFAVGDMFLKRVQESIPRQYAVATTLPDGRVLLTGGGSAIAEIHDPWTGTWNVVARMGQPRVFHGATLLADGRVLVTGGQSNDGGQGSASCEFFDPVSQTWTPAPSMTTRRGHHTATLLPNGKVLVAGGSNELIPWYPFRQPLADAEIFDPVRNTWSAIARMATARDAHTATLLADGRVLVAGGQGGLHAMSAAELFDPVRERWIAAGPLTTARSEHVAVRTADGSVLAIGGNPSYDSPNDVILASAERFDPATSTWSPAGSMSSGRVGHAAGVLRDGRIIVAGGELAGTADLFDPVANRWTPAGSLSMPRFGPVAATLPDGTVLLVGGKSGSTWPAASERFDPARGTWTTEGSVTNDRYVHTAHLLPDGKVLIAGGEGGGGWSGGIRDSVEWFDPVASTWEGVGPMVSRREYHVGAVLPSGRPFVAGGWGGPDGLPQASAERFDARTNAWSDLPPMASIRMGASAIVLPSGLVLVTGGFDLVGAQASAEVFDEIAGTWRAVASMHSGHAMHTTTLLRDGRVLVVGGGAEIYDPLVDVWTVAASPAEGRSSHTATLLADGRVLVTGGDAWDGALSSAEIFDPATNVWTRIASMAAPRKHHTATLVGNGRVLVTGGLFDDPQRGSLGAQVYDPLGDTWTAVGYPEQMNRVGHTATLLPDGRVLLIGSHSQTDYFKPAP